MEKLTTLATRALAVSVPAAINTSVLFSIGSLAGVKILNSVAMIPGSLLLMYGTGWFCQTIAKVAFKADETKARDVFILSGLILGGAMALVVLLLLGSDVLVASWGAGLGGGIALSIFAYRYLEVYTRQRFAQRTIQDAQTSLAQLTGESLEVALKDNLLKCELKLGSFHPATAAVIKCFSEYCDRLGRSFAAQTLLTRCLEIYNNLPPGHELDEADCLYRIARYQVRAEKDEAARAVSVCKRALAIREKMLPPNDPKLLETYCLLGRLLARSEKHKEALQVTETAFKRLGDPKMHLDLYFDLCGQHISHLIADRKLNQARQYIEQNLNLRMELGMDDAPETVELAFQKAELDRGSGDKAAADESIKLAFEKLKLSGGPDYENAKTIIESCKELILDELWNESQQAFWSALIVGDQEGARKAITDDETVATLRGKDGWRAVHWCCFWEMERLLESLFFRETEAENDDDGDFPPAWVAARWGRRRVLVSVLNRGADPDRHGPDGRRLLHAAVMGADRRTLDLLINRKVDINVTDDEGWTPLHLATYLGDNSLVLELITREAFLDGQDNLGRTPLYLAVEKEQLLIAQTLLFNGAEAKIPDNEGKRPSQLAREKGLIELSNLLINHEAGEDGDA